MQTQPSKSELELAEELASGFYLRTGRLLRPEVFLAELQRKFNPNHDPEDGRFTFGSGGGGFGGRAATQVSNRSSGGDRYPTRVKLPTYPVRVELPTAKPVEARTHISVHAEKIRTIMPASGKLADVYSKPLGDAMTTHGIHSPEQQAGFLAQVAVESGSLRHTAEGLNYSAERLTQVWPSRFPTIESARPYAHNPEALADRVYGDRMGNRGVVGAGYRYRGRGLIQVTGRDRYRELGYENNPEALENPQLAADSAAAYWRANSLHRRTTRALNRQQFDATSRYVNGGSHGLDERWMAYQRALAALRRREPPR